MNARWRIAYLLDRSRRWCWASLVTWAIDGQNPRRSRSPLRDARDVSICDLRSPDTIRTGACYCGKFKVEK